MAFAGRARQQEAVQDQALAEALRRDIGRDLRPGADRAILGSQIFWAEAAAQRAQVLEGGCSSFSIMK